MKRLSLLVCLMLIGFATAVAEAPLVSNVEAHQRTDGSKIVDIFYDVSDTDSSTLTVSLKISSDGGQTYSIFPQTVSGDIGSGVTPGQRKHIVWDAGKDLPGVYGTQYRAAVTASDGGGGGGPTITVPINLPSGAKPLEMILIEAGTFTMGSPASERGRWDGYEWYPHQVTLTKDFYLGKYEVTQAQYQAVMGSNLSYFGNKPNNPVEQVSWYDAAKFCNALSRMEGLQPVYTESGNWPSDINANGYRLPTEAEWEYACRAGTTTRFSFGDALECSDSGEIYCELADQYMWWWGNNTYGGYGSGTKEVGLKLPNPWGLYDIHGNVWEWCGDWWRDPYDRGDQVDPFNQVSASYRVLRGGYWYYDLRSCRSANRYRYSPYSTFYDYGFRVSRTP